MIDYGVRAGGGMGDILPMISYNDNTSYYFGQFFYNMVFYILIILILGNIFLGIIVDTFAALRDQNEFTEEDKNLKCYICQIWRDQCLNKKIDYEKHIKEDHFTWNYVYFLTYLHITNPNDFNALENYLWDMLSQKDISWFPIYNE